MKKYHLNPNSGEVSVCRAFIRKCKYAEYKHASTMIELQKEFEHLNVAEVIPKVSRKSASFRAVGGSQAVSGNSEVSGGLVVSSALDSVVPVRPDGSEVRVFDRSLKENKNVSVFYCKSCDKHLSLEDEDDLMTYRYCKCSCGAVAKDKDELSVAVVKENLWMADVRSVKDGSVFHVTERDNWHSEIAKNSELLVHLGSEEASFHRGRDIANESKGGVNDRLFVYELKVVDSDDASFELNKDLNSAWDVSLSDDNEKVRSDFHLYVNEYEDPGSVSLISTARRVEVVGRRKLAVDFYCRETLSDDPDFEVSSMKDSRAAKEEAAAEIWEEYVQRVKGSSS